MNMHLQFVRDAVALNADLIVFPELSLTNYEPELAKALALDFNTPLFDPFQVLSNEHDITISVGMPLNSSIGITIGMLIFQPNTPRKSYAKQILHADELPYFVGGEAPNIVEIKHTKIAFGICYETLQSSHLIRAHENGAELYIASVAKSENGVQKAMQHFPVIAQEFKIPILMANCVGPCDNFQAAGKSTAWNEKGEPIAQLDSSNTGVFIYDTKSQTATKTQKCVVIAQPSDLQPIFQMYEAGKRKLEQNGIYQWTASYPRLSIIEEDIKNGVLYVLKKGNTLIGAINLSDVQEPEYATIDWEFKKHPILVIHRMIVHPNEQGRGYGTYLMRFAEKFALKRDYLSIRLDAYSQNKGVLDFYRRSNYAVRGSVNFPGREHPFFCLEKQLNQTS